MTGSGAPARLRGRLATRLLAVFALASVLPVLLTSLIAYRQLVRAAESRQARAIHDEAKDSALTLLSELQVASARLDSASPQRADAWDEFSSLTVTTIGAATGPGGPLASMPVRSRTALASGKPVLYWQRARGAPTRLLLVRQPLGTERVAIGILDLDALLERARPPNPASGMALADISDASILIRPDRLEVPLAAFRALRASTTVGAGPTFWRDPTGAWFGTHWDLFLEGTFAAPPLRILVCEAAGDGIAGLSDLRLTIPLSLLGAMLFSVLLAVMQLRRYLGPLDTLTAATRRLGARDFDVEVRIDTRDELAALGEDFNRMARALRHRVTTLEALSEVDRLLLATASLDGVLEALLPCIGRILQCAHVSLILVDRDASRYARLYEHDPAAGITVASRRVELDATVLAETSQDARAWPLMLGERLAGALHLRWDSFEAARDADEAVARGFVDRLRVALVNLSHRDELVQRANFDGLTGLANRNFFRTILGERIAQCARAGSRSALLFVDLDDFKKVNDSAGHEAGDLLLVEVAARLKACCGPEEVVARLGGDEFAVVLAAGADSTDAARAGRRILEALAPPVEIAGSPRRISASIGAALIPEHGDNVALLLRNADIAMYRSKDEGRNRLTLFTAALHDRMAEKVALEVALQAAIEADELALSYQPIMTGAGLGGVEALLRWPRAPIGEVGPAVFIPIAEQSGLIVHIGRWVLRRACEDFVRWRAAGIAPGYVSINVAPRQLETGEIVEELAALLRTHDLLPSQVQLEVIESAMAEGPAVVETLRRISRLGVRLALDDFGTGYSSLSHLHHLPFDVVKIDRSFIAGLPESGVARQLVRTILHMAHGLDKVVVAEGVESEGQRDLLRSLGCDAMQGFLFSKPLPEGEIRRVLEAELDPSSHAARASA